jgi:alkylhydroperoxidase family enzyme
VLDDPATAPVSARVRAALRLVERLTLQPDGMSSTDIDLARAAGLDDYAIRDAAMVCVMFSIITRLADTLDFAIPPSFGDAAKALTGKRGYRLPGVVLMLPR